MVVYLPSLAEKTTGSLQWETLCSGNPNVTKPNLFSKVSVWIIWFLGPFWNWDDENKSRGGILESHLGKRGITALRIMWGPVMMGLTSSTFEKQNLQSQKCFLLSTLTTPTRILSLNSLLTPCRFLGFREAAESTIQFSWRLVSGLPVLLPG